MTLRAALADRTPYRKFLIVVGLTLTGSVLFSVIGGTLSELIFGVGLADVQKSIPAEDPDSAYSNGMRLIQAFSLIGTFLIPALVAAWLFSDDSIAFLGAIRKPGIRELLIVLVLFICAVPFINWMMALNQGIILPASMRAFDDWMRSMEEAASRLTEMLVSGTSVSDLFLNLLVIAVLPAIAEEFLFRGVLQRQFSLLAGNRHAGIWLTAFLFSALHMQFLGFLPRFMLGALLGYLYAWSGSIWLPVFAHFCNNAIAVFMTWAFAAGLIAVNPDLWGTGQEDGAALFISVFLTLSGIWLLARQQQTQPNA